MSRSDRREAAGAPGAEAPAAPAWDAVLFDLDDTLLDLRTAQHAAFEATVRRQWAGAAEAGADLMARAREAFAADAGGHYQRYMAGELGFHAQRLARAADALALLGAPEGEATPDEVLWTAEYETVVRSHWALFPSTAEVLRAVRDSGRGVGIVTNNVAAYQRAKADALGLDWVQVLIGSDTAGAPKPDPAPFLAGCARLGVRPARTLMVGDSLAHDVAGARAAGLVGVWLRSEIDDDGRAAEAEAVAAAARETAEPSAPTWDGEHGCWRIGALAALRAWL